jgi:hypothetical protein
MLRRFCLNCGPYHATMDSEGDHATLNSHHAPYSWCLCMSISRRLLGEEICSRQVLTEITMHRCSSHIVINKPGDLFACLEAPSPSNPVPRNTAMDVTIPSSSVAAHRRHAVEKPRGSATFAGQERCNDLAKAIAAAAAVTGTPVPTLSWDFQPLGFDQYAAPEARTFES